MTLRIASALFLFLMLGPVARAESFAPWEWMAYCAGEGSGACGLGRAWTAEDLAWVHASVNDAMTPDPSAAGPWVAFPADRRGNCADYTVTYRSALGGYGFDLSGTRVAIGYVGEASAETVHSVLEVILGEQVWILDPINAGIYHADARPYVWTPIATQSPDRIAWTQPPSQ